MVDGRWQIEKIKKSEMFIQEMMKKRRSRRNRIE